TGGTPWSSTPISIASGAAPHLWDVAPHAIGGTPWWSTPISTASEAAPHLWDVATGLDLLALPGRAHELIMSPGRHRLPGRYGDQRDSNSVIWDARTESSDARARRVAGARLRAFLEYPAGRESIPDRAELESRIQRDPVLRPGDRRVALAMLDDFRNAAIVRAA